MSLQISDIVIDGQWDIRNAMIKLNPPINAEVCPACRTPLGSKVWVDVCCVIGPEAKGIFRGMFPPDRRTVRVALCGPCFTEELRRSFPWKLAAALPEDGFPLLCRQLGFKWSKCDGCKREIYINYPRSFGGHHWCSTRCRQRIQRKRRRESREATSFLCEVCEDLVESYGRRDTRYCSPKCRQKAYRQRLARSTKAKEVSRV